MLINSSWNHLEVFNLAKSLDIHGVLLDFAHEPNGKEKRATNQKKRAIHALGSWLALPSTIMNIKKWNLKEN